MSVNGINNVSKFIADITGDSGTQHCVDKQSRFIQQAFIEDFNFAAGIKPALLCPASIAFKNAVRFDGAHMHLLACFFCFQCSDITVAGIVALPYHHKINVGVWQQALTLTEYRSTCTLHQGSQIAAGLLRCGLFVFSYLFGAKEFM